MLKTKGNRQGTRFRALGLVRRGRTSLDVTEIKKTNTGHGKVMLMVTELMGYFYDIHNFLMGNCIHEKTQIKQQKLSLRCGCPLPLLSSSTSSSNPEWVPFLFLSSLLPPNMHLFAKSGLGYLNLPLHSLPGASLVNVWLELQPPVFPAVFLEFRIVLPWTLPSVFDIKLVCQWNEHPTPFFVVHQIGFCTFVSMFLGSTRKSHHQTLVKYVLCSFGSPADISRLHSLPEQRHCDVKSSVKEQSSLSVHLAWAESETVLNAAAPLKNISARRFQPITKMARIPSYQTDASDYRQNGRHLLNVPVAFQVGLFKLCSCTQTGNELTHLSAATAQHSWSKKQQLK